MFFTPFITGAVILFVVGGRSSTKKRKIIFIVLGIVCIIVGIIINTFMRLASTGF